MDQCRNCEAWIRRSRSRCPWCGALVQRTTSGVKAARSDSEEDTTQALRLIAAPSGRDRHFWTRAFAGAFLFVLLVTLFLGGLGIYLGIADRRVANTEAAVEWFEQGLGYMEEGRYDLAEAAFREALRLEPGFEGAAQMLRLSSQSVATGDEVPAPAPPDALDGEALLAEAQTAFDAGDFGIAAATYDILQTQAPSFRPVVVLDGLIAAHLAAGNAALESGRLDEAIRHFDRILAADPDESEALRLRRMTSAYRTGRAAFEAGDWSSAADQLRVVYLLDPDFQQVSVLLARSHLELAAAFEQRDIWCEAAQQYRAAAGVEPDNATTRRAETAEARCSTRSTAAPPASPTPVPPEPVATTAPLTGTATITGTVPVGTVIPSPLPGSPTPLPTATPAGLLGYRLAAPVSASFDDSCGGHYIRGAIRNAQGAPLAGITVLAVDQFGNRYLATSKVDPPGTYDIPIPAQVLQYQIRVVAGDEPLSENVIVVHDEDFAQSPQACHLVNWVQGR